MSVFIPESAPFPRDILTAVTVEAVPKGVGFVNAG